MPYKMMWLVEKRVIYTCFEGVITAEDLSQFLHELQAYIHNGTPPIHHISNGLKIERIKFSLSMLQRMVSRFKVVHQLSWNININENRLVTTIASIGNYLINVNNHTVKTLDEAIAYLKQKDPTLKNLDWNNAEL
ncbi:MAG: hypothetical protein D6711_12660 [Chloroflexi bacterium]|nr:MAG: hypothetical protein D6711_12660 [Chloroflexota bacterium]